MVMVKVKSNKGNKAFATAADAAEWLIEHQPEVVAVNGVDVSDQCEWTEYGIALGVIDYAVCNDAE